RVHPLHGAAQCLDAGVELRPGPRNDGEAALVIRRALRAESASRLPTDSTAPAEPCRPRPYRPDLIRPVVHNPEWRAASWRVAAHPLWLVSLQSPSDQWPSQVRVPGLHFRAVRRGSEIIAPTADLDPFRGSDVDTPRSAAPHPGAGDGGPRCRVTRA